MTRAVHQVLLESGLFGLNLVRQLFRALVTGGELNAVEDVPMPAADAVLRLTGAVGQRPLLTDAGVALLADGREVAFAPTLTDEVHQHEYAFSRQQII